MHVLMNSVDIGTRYSLRASVSGFYVLQNILRLGIGMLLRDTGMDGENF